MCHHIVIKLYFTVLLLTVCRARPWLHTDTASIPANVRVTTDWVTARSGCFCETLRVREPSAVVVNAKNLHRFIWGSESADYEGTCKALWSGRTPPTFQRNVFQLSKRRQNVPPKRWWKTTGPQCVTSQITVLFIPNGFTTVYRWNLQWAYSRSTDLWGYIWTHWIKKHECYYPNNFPSCSRCTKSQSPHGSFYSEACGWAVKIIFWKQGITNRIIKSYAQ
jgi:hypothetical protein